MRLNPMMLPSSEVSKSLVFSVSSAPGPGFATSWLFNWPTYSSSYLVSSLSPHWKARKWYLRSMDAGSKKQHKL